MAQLTQGLLVWKLVLAGAGHEQQPPKAMSKVQLVWPIWGGGGGGDELVQVQCMLYFGLRFITVGGSHRLHWYTTNTII